MSNMNLDQALSTVESAPDPSALFPDLDTAKSRYRQLARLIHPDRIPDSTNGNHRRAESAFNKLADFYAQRTGATSRVRRIGEWTIQGGLARGSLCDVYEVNGRGKEAVLKVSRQPRDNPLLSQEAAVLKTLQGDALPENFRRYAPRYLGALNVSGRRATVVERAMDCLTLEHIRQQYPQGIPFPHVVWMGNRLLEFLGAVHRAGILHGAILPQHLMYRPSDHGLVVVDWTASTSTDARPIPLISKRWSGHYPPEVRAKRPAPATDIYMAAEALRYAATTHRVPRVFRAILDWMTAESVAARPGDAWEVQDRWRAAARQEYGEPKFVELRLPTN